MNTKTLLSSTTVAAFAASASGANAAPLANLFEIRTYPAHLVVFKQVGDGNLSA